MKSINENYNKVLKKIKEAIQNQYSKTFSDEEILEKCLKFSKEHLNELINEDPAEKEQISEKIKRILANAKEYQLYDLDKSDDELLYGIP